MESELVAREMWGLAFGPRVEELILALDTWSLLDLRDGEAFNLLRVELVVVVFVVFLATVI